MDFDFYRMTTVIFIIILIVSLVTMFIIMLNANSMATFPSVQNPCPDYWTYNSSDNSCSPPSDSINSGKIKTPSPYTITDVCSNKNWADSNNILWDGVTNYNGCKKT